MSEEMQREQNKIAERANKMQEKVNPVRLDKMLWENCRVEDIVYMRQTLIDPGRKDSYPADVVVRAESSYLDAVLSCLRSDFDEFQDVKDDGRLGVARRLFITEMIASVGVTAMVNVDTIQLLCWNYI
jgi:hypothetical protein